MNCTNCGESIKHSICVKCGIDLSGLLLKLADDAQVRRDYHEAMDYMEILEKSCNNEEQKSDINRKIAQIAFAMTDLTGNKLEKEKQIKKGYKVVKYGIFTMITISAILLIYNILRIYILSSVKYEILN